MKNKNDIYFDMDILMSELKEALSEQELKAIEIEKGNLMEKLIHLFILKEYDLFLLFIKSLFIKHKIVLPDIFIQEHCSNELKESLCAAIVANWISIV